MALKLEKSVEKSIDERDTDLEQLKHKMAKL
jgi:hypothetical protein